MSKPRVISDGRGQAGATLVEALVALTVVALTLITAAGGLQLLAGSGDRGAQVAARQEMFSRGIAVIRRDIERLERMVWKRGQVMEFAFHADAAHLAFVVVEPPFPTEAGPYFVTYSILRRPHGDVLTRSRVPFDPSITDLRRLPQQERVDVLEGNYRFRFAYLNRTGGGEQWLTQWSDPDRLPDLVRVEVASLAKGGRPMQPIVFRARIDAERSCVKEQGSACTVGNQGILISGSR
jgi:hypothetical protein